MEVILMDDISFKIEKGDLMMVSDDENMIGACKRRLDCYKDSPYIYNDYGSELETLIGLRKSDVSLSLVEQEVVNTLSQDSRINSVSADAEYTENGIKIDITIDYGDSSEASFDYTVGEGLE